MINKRNRTCRIVNFAVRADQRVKLEESKKKNKYQDLAWESKTHESDGCTNYNWCSCYNGLVQGLEDLEKKRTSGDHPNYSIIENGQNTEKSPGDLRLALTQTPVRNHRLTLVRKTLKIIIIIRRRRRRRKRRRRRRVK